MKKIILILLFGVNISMGEYIGEVHLRDGLTIKILEIHRTCTNGFEEYYINVKIKIIPIEIFRKNKYRYTEPFKEVKEPIKCVSIINTHF